MEGIKDYWVVSICGHGNNGFWIGIFGVGMMGNRMHDGLWYEISWMWIGFVSNSGSCIVDNPQWKSKKVLLLDDSVNYGDDMGWCCKGFNDEGMEG